MRKTKKSLGIMLTALFTLVSVFNYIPANAAVKAKKATVPVVQFVNAPITEYTVGDRVKFDISAPNYGGKVEYRVILWNDSKKIANDLWNVSNGYPTRYYTKWQPWGNNIFTLGWTINEPGNYRITVYAKRVGVPNTKAAVKGMNCDSYKESVAFTVKQNLTLLDKDGQTYGSKDANKPEQVAHDVTIAAKNITLNNVSVIGDLYIKGDNAAVKNVNVTGKVYVDPGKDGVVNLESVTAMNLEVLSGGKDSIHLKNVKVESLNVNSSGAVRIETDGTTNIVATNATGTVILDKKNGTFGTITISKNAAGETIIEFRGNIKEKIYVESPATIKTAVGSTVENLIISPVTADSKIVLQGSFANVEVSKEAQVEVASGTTITKVNALANAEIKVSEGATVQTLNTNNNDVKIDNHGTITEGNTGNTGDAGTYYPPTPTYEDGNIDTAIGKILNFVKEYYFVNNAIDITKKSFSTNDNKVEITVSSAFKDKTFEDMVTLARAKILAKGHLTEQTDIDNLADLKSAFELIKVTDPQQNNIVVDFNRYITYRLAMQGHPVAATFFLNLDTASYNAVVDKLASDDHDSYEELSAIFQAILPLSQPVSIPATKVDGKLVLSSVAVNNVTVYNGTTDTVISASEISTVLGLNSIKTAKMSELNGKSVVVTYNGINHPSDVYKYTLTIKVSE